MSSYPCPVATSAYHATLCTLSCASSHAVMCRFGIGALLRFVGQLGTGLPLGSFAIIAHLSGVSFCDAAAPTMYLQAPPRLRRSRRAADPVIRSAHSILTTLSTETTHSGLVLSAQCPPAQCVVRLSQRAHGYRRGLCNTADRTRHSARSHDRGRTGLFHASEGFPALSSSSTRPKSPTAPLEDEEDP